MKNKKVGKKNVEFWMCDLETTTNESEYYKQNNDVCIVVAGALKATYQDGELVKMPFLYELTFLELLNKIIEVDDNEKIILYFHNLGQFDGSYILDELTKNGFRFNNFKSLMDEKDINCLIGDNANIYQINIRYKGREIEINDSLRQLTLSVKVLGETQKLYKLENDYVFEPVKHKSQLNPTDIEYLKRDCEIPIHPLISVLTTFKNPRMTAGSTSLRGLEDWMIDHFEGESETDKKRAKNIFKYTTYADIELCCEMFDWCFGGLTFYNRLKQHKLINGVYCYDATSFYPTQMVTKPMIIGNKCYDVAPDYVAKSDEVLLYKLIINKAKLKGNKHDFYFLRNFANQQKRFIDDENLKTETAKYVSEINKSIVCYFFENEFKELLNWYDIDYEILETKMYKTAWYMRDYILYLFEQRKLLKKNKDPSELTMKIFLNSVFGKLMENPIKAQMIFIPKRENKEYQIGDIIDEFELIRRKNQEFDINDYEAWVALPTKSPDYYRNPIIGAYITASARTQLMSIVRKHRDYVVYGDTDSIFVTKRIKEFEMDQSGDLGSWKNEYPELKDGFDMFVYGRKRYVAYKYSDIVKIAMCGASKSKFVDFLIENKLLNEKDLKALINRRVDNMKLAKKSLKGKKYLYDHYYQIRNTKD